MKNGFQKVISDGYVTILSEILGVSIVMSLVWNDDSMKANIVEWIGGIAVLLITLRCIFIFTINKGKIVKLGKKLDTFFAIVSFAWAILFFLFASPLASWLRYGLSSLMLVLLVIYFIFNKKGASCN